MANPDVRAMPRPNPANPSATPHVIIPGHDLVPVPDPNQLDYYRCIGQFRLFVGSSFGRGTGTLIQAGANVGILTCAHNLCIRGTSTFKDSADFTPCQGPEGSPFEPIAVPQSNMWISPGYKISPVAGGRYDYAVVRLKSSELPPPSELGPLPQMQPLTLDSGIAMQVTGYPSAVFDTTMAYSVGSFTPPAVTNGLVYYNASTTEGSSGSGVCFKDNLQSITAVHVGGSEAAMVNAGVYLTREIIEEITEVLAS